MCRITSAKDGGNDVDAFLFVVVVDMSELADVTDLVLDLEVTSAPLVEKKVVAPAVDLVDLVDVTDLVLVLEVTSAPVVGKKVFAPAVDLDVKIVDFDVKRVDLIVARVDLIVKRVDLDASIDVEDDKLPTAELLVIIVEDPISIVDLGCAANKDIDKI